MQTSWVLEQQLRALHLHPLAVDGLEGAGVAF